MNIAPLFGNSSRHFFTFVCHVNSPAQPLSILTILFWYIFLRIRRKVKVPGGLSNRTIAKLLFSIEKYLNK